MYKILGGDGKEYGPVSAETLRQWVKEGRANAQTKVMPEGAADWCPLTTVAELADVFSAPPTIASLAAYPESVPSGGVYDGDYDLDFGGCLSRAWATLSANFWLLVGGGAIYLLIVGGISAFAQIPLLGPLFSILSFIITGPLLGGVYLFVLQVLRGQRAEVGDVFCGFRDNLGGLILGSIVPALITGATAIPGASIMGVSIFMMVNDNVASAPLIVIAALGFLLALIPAIYLSVCWTFTLPLVADKRLDFWTAMRTSRAQVSRHWWTILGFGIVIGLLNFAGLLLCCVGIFVSLPLCFAALLCAYETIFIPRPAHPGTGA